MPFHYDDDKKKKKKRIIETDPAKKAWKALQSGGLDPMPFDDDFDIYEAKKHLKEEVKGMGPEGKRFLKDKLSGKKYEGKLKPKYKKDLLKELEGMSSKGKSYVKKELGEPSENYYRSRMVNLEDERKLKLDKLKKFKSNITKPETEKKDKPEAWKGPDWLKPKDWDNMSEKEKDRVHDSKMGIVKGLGQLGRAFSDKGAKSYVKKEKGDSKPYKAKSIKEKLVGQLKERLFGSDKMDDEERKKSEGLKAKPKVFGSSSKKILKDLFEKSNKRVEESLKKKLPQEAREKGLEKLIGAQKADAVKERGKRIKILESAASGGKFWKGSKPDKKKLLGFEKEKGDSKNWIKDAVKKPGALRETAKRMKLIKGDELLSSKDLDELKSKAKKSNNALLMRRVNLAKTFKKMKK